MHDPASPPRQRPTNGRVATVAGKLPHAIDTVMSTRSQKLSGMLQARSQSSYDDGKRRKYTTVSAATSDVDEHDLEAGLHDDGVSVLDRHQWQADSAASRKQKQSWFPPGSASSASHPRIEQQQRQQRQRRDSIISDASRPAPSSQLRSVRLIGNSNLMYRWEQYFKTDAELATMRKPIRRYHERNNHRIQSYLYIDRLLDSSLPRDLIEEYNTNDDDDDDDDDGHRGGKDGGRLTIPGPDIPCTISEDTDQRFAKEDEEGEDGGEYDRDDDENEDADEDVRRQRQAQKPHIKHSVSMSSRSLSPVRVKRTPKALFKIPHENTPLLNGSKHDDDDDDEDNDNDNNNDGNDDVGKSNNLNVLDGDEEDESSGTSRTVSVAIYVNLAANGILLAGKIAVIVLTSSLSVLASLVDACLDFLSTGIVWTTTKLVAHQDRYAYPVGRRRLEPIGVLVFSVIMITSFFQVFLECFNRLKSGDESIVQLGLPSIIIMASTVVVKLGCWLWCRLIRNSSVQALAQDAMTDVVFNTFSIIFPIIGYYAKLWWLDALGGMILSIYVIVNWSRTSLTHIRNLTGAVASPTDHSILLYLTMRFAHCINNIQGCQAYHAGDKLNVEVDVVLDEKMTLRDSHDLGESLQYVLESVPSVDRAFVHLDYKKWNLPSHLSQQAD